MTRFCPSFLKKSTKALLKSPREMWVTSVFLRILLAMAYFTFASILVAFLEDEYGFGDSSALNFYGIFGSVISFFALVLGPVYDWLGIRSSLMLCGLFSMIGFTMLSMAFDVGFMFYLATLLFIPLGLAFGLPVLDLASAKYSYPENESQVYSLGYSTSNMGGGLGSLTMFLLSLEVSRLVQVNIVHPADKDELLIHNHGVTAQRLMILLCGVVSGIAALIAGLTIGNVHMTKHGSVVRDNVRSVDDADAAADEAEAPVSESAPAVIVDPRWRVRVALHNAWLWLRYDLIKLLRDPGFRRLSLFVFTTLFARHVFQQLNTTLILYLYRVFGPHAPVNAFYAINPIAVSILAPVASFITPYFDMFHCIILGSAVSSSSLLIMALFEPTFVSVAMALFLFTVGEAIYSPLTTQYVMALSPDGKKGQYSALTSAPIFLGKVIVSLVSGGLLENNCSKGGDKSSCGRVWLVISGVSFGTPVGLLALYRVIHTPEVRNRLSARKANAAIYDDTNDRTEYVDHDNDPVPLKAMVAHSPVYRGTAPPVA